MTDGRTLYVILTANASAYKAALRGAGDDTDRFGHKVDEAGRRLDATGDSADRSAAQIAGFEKNTGQAGNEIDRMSGRLRIMLDALSLLGPALVPIGAVAIPAVTGLAAQLAIAGGAAGATMLAFLGMGDALTAINAAQLNPTAANLEKARVALDKMGPSAAAFTLELDAMMPRIRSVQQAAASGFFPGAQAGLDDMMHALPNIRDLVNELAQGAGDMAASLGDDIDSKRFREFTAFVESEARPTLATLYDTIANLTAGLGEMWMAFDRPNDQFGAWLLEQSKDFDTWASKVDQTQGFEDFLNYINEEGPRVADALGSIGNMTLQIVEAAAPIGGPVLDGIAAMADAIAAIADSPLGTSLFGAAAAATVLNRGLQITAGLLTRIGVTSAETSVMSATKGVTTTAPAGSMRANAAVVGGALTPSTYTPAAWTASREASAAARDLASAEAAARTAHAEYVGSLRASSVAQELIPGTKATEGMIGAIDNLNAANQTQAEAAEKARVAEERRSAAIRQTAKNAAVGAGAVAAMAVLATDTGQSLGLTNTAMFGMTGAMAGPWGAAIGAGTGLLMDFSKAAGQAADATLQFDRATKNISSVSGYSAAVDTLQNQANDYFGRHDDAKQGFGSYMGEAISHPVESTGLAIDALSNTGIGGAVSGLMGGAFGLGDGKTQLDAYAEAADSAQSKMLDLETGAHAVGSAFGIMGTDTASLDQALQAANPAMSALGITTDDLMAAVRNGTIMDLVGQMTQWQATADSTAGKTDAVGVAIGNMGREAISAAGSAQALGTALENALRPSIDLEAATDAWHTSLKGLRADLKPVDGGAFEGYGKAAMKNKELTRDYATDSIDRLTKLAGVTGTTQEDMAKAVAATRREFIRSGIAAGIDADVIERRANKLGLTPKLVRTVFKSAGIGEAELRARKLTALYKGMPKDVRTDIQTNGIPQTKKEIDDLVDKYHLTEKQRTALLSIRDLASKPIGDILTRLGILDRTSAHPKVQAQAAAAQRALDRAAASLAALDGRVARSIVEIHTIRTGAGGQGAGYGGAADGTTVPITGRGYADRHPYLLADGEEVVTDSPARGRPATTYRPVLKAINSGAPAEVIRGMLADGGSAGRYGAPTARYGSSYASGDHRPVVVVRDRLPDQLELVVDGQRMTAFVRGHAEQVVHRRTSQQDDADTLGDRMDWR